MSFEQMYWIAAGLVVVLTLSALVAWSLRQIRRDLSHKASDNRAVAKGEDPAAKGKERPGKGPGAPIAAPPGPDGAKSGPDGAEPTVSGTAAAVPKPAGAEPPVRSTWAAAIPFAGRRESPAAPSAGAADPEAGDPGGADSAAGVPDLRGSAAPSSEAPPGVSGPGTAPGALRSPNAPASPDVPGAQGPPGLSALHTAPLVLNPEELESGLTLLDEDHILRLSALEEEASNEPEEETAVLGEAVAPPVGGAPSDAWTAVEDHLARAGALGWMTLTGEGVLLGSDQAYDARVVERFGRLAAEAARSGALVGLSRPGRFTLRGDEGLVYMVSAEDLEASGNSTGLPDGTWIVAFLENTDRHPDPVWESLFVSPVRRAIL